MRPDDILKEMVSKVGPSVNLKICVHCFKTDKGGMYGCLAVFTGVLTDDPCLRANWDACPVNPVSPENLKALKWAFPAEKEAKDGPDKVS